MKSIQTIGDFKTEIETNLELQQAFRDDPIKASQQLPQTNPLGTDKWIYRIIVLALGITIISIIIGIIFLIGQGKIVDDKGVPTILTALGSAAIGALSGLLAPSPRSN